MPKKKVDIDQVEHAARSLDLEPEKIQQLINDLQQSLEEESIDKSPREKKQLIIIANTEGDEQLNEIICNIPMQVVEFPLEEDHNLVLQKINEAVYDFNSQPKNENNKIFKVFEGLEFVKPAKFLKDRKVIRKSKHPLIVITTNNLIPN